MVAIGEKGIVLTSLQESRATLVVRKLGQRNNLSYAQQRTHPPVLLVQFNDCL